MTTTGKTANLNIEIGKPNKDGFCKVYVRVAIGSSRARIPMPYKVRTDEVVRGTIRNTMILSQVQRAMDEYRGRIASAGMMALSWNADECAEYITMEERRKAEAERMEKERKGFRLDFAQWLMDDIMRISREGRDSTASTLMIAKNHLCRYNGGRGIDVNDMTKAWAIGFIEWMRSRGIGGQGIDRYCAAMSASYERAKKRYNDPDDDFLKIRRSPFTATSDYWKFRYAPGEERKNTNVLTPKFVRYMSGMSLLGLPAGMGIARDAWMLSFALCGMNATDMIDVESLNDDGAVEYTRKKTGKVTENAHIAIHIDPHAEKFHKRLLSSKGGRLWLFKDLYRQPHTMNVRINSDLKKVIDLAVGRYAEEKCVTRKKAAKELGLPEDISTITFYSARHTWATIAANDCMVPMDLVDRCLCHAGRTLAERSYVKRDYRAINEANGKVLEFTLGRME